MEMAGPGFSKCRVVEALTCGAPGHGVAIEEAIFKTVVVVAVTMSVQFNSCSAKQWLLLFLFPVDRFFYIQHYG